jgi:hypothetical protein
MYLQKTNSANFASEISVPLDSPEDRHSFNFARETGHSPNFKQHEPKYSARPKHQVRSGSMVPPPAYESLTNKLSIEKISYVARKVLPVIEIRPSVISALNAHSFKSYSTYEIDAVLEPLINSVRIGESDLFAFATEDQILEHAKDYVRMVESFKSSYGSSRLPLKGVIDFAESLSEHTSFTGIPVPLRPRTIHDRETEQHFRARVRGAAARMCKERWWRKKLRDLCHRTAENYMRSSGRVGKGISPYISSYTNSRLRSRERASREFMDACEVESDQGDVLSLADVYASSLANPRNRISETYARAVGCDRIREEFSLSAVFLTMTAPSRFHARTVSGDFSYPNSHFDGSTPDESQVYLRRVWARIRAALARADIHAFGMRVSEPHQDGTFHWHLLGYVEPNQLAQFIEICRHYSCQEDAHELTTERRRKARFHAEVIDCTRAAPRTYLFKYLTKNVVGSSDISDETGQPIHEGVDSARRLASTYSVRQFQFFGQPSVTVWRELRRLREKNLGEVSAEDFSDIRDAACSGNWGKFVELMGGVCVRREDQPIKPLRKERGENDYGEIIYEIRGLVMRRCLHEMDSGQFSVSTVMTREKSWRILSPNEVKHKHKSSDFEVARSAALG